MGPRRLRDSDALIAIHEGVVRDERIAYSSALFLLGRVEFLPAKTGKDILQCGLQQSLIPDAPDADAPASFLGNKLVKWKALLSFGAIPFPDFGTRKRLACTKWLWIWGRTASTLPGVTSASGTKTFLPQAVRALRAGRIHLILW